MAEKVSLRIERLLSETVEVLYGYSHERWLADMDSAPESTKAEEMWEQAKETGICPWPKPGQPWPKTASWADRAKYNLMQLWRQEDPKAISPWILHRPDQVKVIRPPKPPALAPMAVRLVHLCKTMDNLCIRDTPRELDKLNCILPILRQHADETQLRLKEELERTMELHASEKFYSSFPQGSDVEFAIQKDWTNTSR